MMNHNRLMDYPSAAVKDPAIDQWFEQKQGTLGSIAHHWFRQMRSCGDDVREILHDYAPTVCLGKYAFAYVNAFTAHVNVGFFYGAMLDDPAGLLQGTGKRMRHLKIFPDQDYDAGAVQDLIDTAYRDIQARVQAITDE